MQHLPMRRSALQIGALALTSPAWAFGATGAAFGQRPSDAPKFNADGSPARWAGNTIISRIDKRSETFMAMLDMQCALMRSGLTKRIAVLPASSYHMTVFEGISFPQRSYNFPKDLPKDASEEFCNAWFLKKLQRFDLACKTPFIMRPLALELQTNPYNILLEPINRSENQKIRTLRDRLADTLQFRAEGHDKYQFHSTLNYFLSDLDPAEQEKFAQVRKRMLSDFIARSPVLELPAPDFCYFDDMLEFRTQIKLKNQS
ncbi:DUF1868 domain-containing protein [Undibacterium sp. RTI2.1]|uniref:DUF1868 domain-containing protein n=1 Tax=unclassified Undibacterium TaxID=2630295 RepID=UPI002AB49C95|nr:MULTISPECIES: DUF1868 domain-containing protein [unclassified Undibacterium]MDY7537807.1 DUF1868 domain-containing protein [Undibacterium sp. 5I1]MEB0030506.1 DUF1868 domain-containing protein [Undibacterium sp. RTI2.1]MEB0116994.1 DUF1868 domain-containing protein [Undibacterium sp. RTI2.2]MEB0229924.1 DUF1868 domain-containing protein [Undibacterium sp. 10I3]MEB0257611.1 DUF1868 domain-containing protein [Undibacterium sp. 5I1]